VKAVARCCPRSSWRKRCVSAVCAEAAAVAARASPSDGAPDRTRGGIHPAYHLRRRAEAAAAAGAAAPAAAEPAASAPPTHGAAPCLPPASAEEKAARTAPILP